MKKSTVQAARVNQLQGPAAATKMEENPGPCDCGKNKEEKKGKERQKLPVLPG